MFVMIEWFQRLSVFASTFHRSININIFFAERENLRLRQRGGDALQDVALAFHVLHDHPIQTAHRLVLFALLLAPGVNGRRGAASAGGPWTVWRPQR